MPIKCPVAPLEFAFLADWFLRERGVRGRVELAYATPLDGAFTKPVASEQLAGLLAEKEIELVTEFNAGEVDGVAGTLASYDGRSLDFDLLVTVPLHGGAPYVERSPGPRRRARLRADRPAHAADGRAAERLRARRRDRPADLEGRLGHALRGGGAAENVARFLAGKELDAGYDGHANCFVETGFHKALLIDFNYDTEPLPGHFPTAFGLPLLRESRLNHLGKLAFQWVYWHALLPGRDLPLLGPGDADRRQAARIQSTRPEEDEHDDDTDRRRAVDVDAEGFLTDPAQWDEESRRRSREENGIPELTDRHWLVVRFMRDRYLTTGTAPTIRSLGKESGVPVKELYELFPKGPAKLAARIGGIPKPKGCI